MANLNRAPQFVFENVGSHGDVMPLLGVAAELVRRGHRCQLLANEHFRAEALARGVGFFATSQKRTQDAAPSSFVSRLYSTVDRIHEYFREPASFDAHTVVVSTHALSSCEPLAEAHRLRTVRLILFPVRIRSLVSPAWPLGAKACGPDGERFLKVTLPAMYRAADTHPEVLAKLNAVRAQVGLSAVSTVSYERSHVVAEAAMFPDWYGMPAEDWPALECLGFPLPSSTEPLPGPVLEFLERCPRPLVFTTGTGVGKPERFFEAAARCCEAVDMPGVFLSPFSSIQRLPSTIAHFAHVELGALLQRSSLIVHHGGMGTTARALQAGIPQVISPIGFDQPDNGHRIELLGAGRVVARDTISGGLLATAVRELLADPFVASRLSLYRAALTASRAIERAADLLEKAAGNAPVSRRATPASSAAALA